MHAISKIIARHADRKRRRGRRNRQCRARLRDAQRSRRGARRRPVAQDGRRAGIRSVAGRGGVRPSLSADPPAGLGVAEEDPRVDTRAGHRRNSTPGRASATSSFRRSGYAFPGALIFGTDSHTVTNSALGCVATGMGHSDIASYLALGYNWLKVPEVDPLRSARRIPAGRLRQGYRAADRATLWRGCRALSRRRIRGPAGRADADGGAVRAVQHGDRFRRQDRIHPARRNHRAMDGAARARSLSGRRRRRTPSQDYGRIIDINVSEIEPLVAVPARPLDRAKRRRPQRRADRRGDFRHLHGRPDRRFPRRRSAS